LKFLIILSLNLCLGGEVQWNNGACPWARGNVCAHLPCGSLLQCSVSAYPSQPSMCEISVRLKLSLK
jgi:hypothetical protein